MAKKAVKKKTEQKKQVKIEKIEVKKVVEKADIKKEEKKETEQKKKTEVKEDKPKKKVKSFLVDELVLTDSSDEAKELYNQSRYGVLLEEGKVQLSLLEALFLIEKNKLDVYDNKKILNFEEFLKKATLKEPNFWIRYSVFKDMRNRGYIIKTALKFGADFRVYDRGVKPGEDHAKWVVFPVNEASTLTWYEFSAKNRVAHSTKKRLLLGIVDAEGDVTYYECKWMRP
ncbi:tRNA-intron lyase [Candidatus Woesearchaeota archaeon]|nr:MAG: tRNA-intron lyase [Candidatus Woesearchaeota archaeon]